ncbi:MAG: YtxH domain-containing protein [Flavobacterium sp.]
MGLSSFFKNLFGSTKDSSANEIADQAETTFEQAKETTAPYIEKAETFVEETFAKVREASEPALESAVEYAHHAKDIVSEYVEKASDSINDVIDSIKEKTAELTSDSETFATETVVDSSEKPITDED